MTAKKPSTHESFKLLYSTQNAARLLDIGETKFREIVKQHQLQPVRILGDPRWRHSDLVRLIDGDDAKPHYWEAAR